MANSIHSTAVIHPQASIGAEVEIGPYCIINAGVELGDGCRLASHVVLDGPAKIGRENTFYPFAAIGHRTQDLKYAGEPTHLEIGDHNTFREFCTVHRATIVGGTTRIGNHGNFLSYSHIAHDCIVGDHVILSNNGTLAGHVTVEDNAGLGGLTAVHQFCRVGRHAFTGGCSKIVQDIPPFMIADGNPATVPGINKTGLERAGFSPDRIRAVQDAHKLLYRAGLNTAQAVEKMKIEFPDNGDIAELIAFITSSKRGIIRKATNS